MKRSFIFTIISVFALLVLSSCYRLPGDGECSVVPMTNNPDVIRDRGSGLVPGAGF